MVEPELHLLDVGQVVFLLDAVVFVEAFFGVAPEAFQAVNAVVFNNQFFVMVL